MKIRDRIKELRRVHASELRPNPRNWRTHPPEQANALRGLLAEVGYADALLARECDDGTLELIDGHLRAETTPDAVVPVLILDVTSQEAHKILLTHDPLSAMAGVDPDCLNELLADVATENQATQAMLDDLAKASNKESLALENGPTINRPDMPIFECFQVVVECQDENSQREVYERMTQEGYPCRLLNL